MSEGLTEADQPTLKGCALGAGGWCPRLGEGAEGGGRGVDGHWREGNAGDCLCQRRCIALRPFDPELGHLPLVCREPEPGGGFPDVEIGKRRVPGATRVYVRGGTESLTGTRRASVSGASVLAGASEPRS